MRDTGTSSAQTAGCGHTEIQQGLLVKQDFPLQRVAGETQQDYWFRSVAGSGVLPVPECTSFKSSADNRFACTENYRFQSVASPGVYQLQTQC